VATATDVATSNYQRNNCRVLQLLPNDAADPWLDVYSCKNLDDPTSKRLRVGMHRPDFVGMVRIRCQYFRRTTAGGVRKTEQAIFRGICGVNAVAPDDVRCSCEGDNYLGLKRASVPITWWLRDRYASSAEDMFDLATPCNSPRLDEQTLPLRVEHLVTGCLGLLVSLPADAGYQPQLLRGEVLWNAHVGEPRADSVLLSELRVQSGLELQHLLMY
jgi:hypothetical protein